MYDSRAQLNPWLKAFVLDKEQAQIDSSKADPRVHGPKPTRHIGFLSCLVRLPDLLQHSPDRQPEIQEVYEAIHTTTQAIGDKYFIATAEMESSNNPDLIRKFALCQKSYALYLSFELIFLGILHVYNPHDQFLHQQSAQLCKQIIELCIEGSIWRPLGSGWITICLASTWVAVTDETQRPDIEAAWSVCWPYGASHSLSSARCLFGNAFDRLRMLAWGSTTPPASPSLSLLEWDRMLESLSPSLVEEMESLDPSQIMA